MKKAKVLVLGLGNPFWGDERAGIAVVEALKGEQLPDGVDVKEAGTPGLGLLNLLEGYEEIIVVDAVDMGLEPGAWRCFGLGEVHLASEEGLRFAHQVGLAEVLELAEALGMRIPPIKIYGIQAQMLGFSEELSPPVARAVREVKEALLKELASV